MSNLQRRPPADVRRQLCREVGFRCPVDDCGSPYLTFHHFDPTWRERRHHNPGGMIALCSNHAAKADNGSYPNEYFRKLKREGVGRAKSVQGIFDYLRRDLIVIVGTNAFHNVETILQLGSRRAIYFNRDSDGYLMLNFLLPGANGHPRAWMKDNVWIVPPGAENVVCPPRGRHLEVWFENGDRFSIEYTEFQDADSFRHKYPAHSSLTEGDQVCFPVTVAEFWEKAEGAGIVLGRGATQIGANTIQNNTFEGGSVGIMLGKGTTSDLPKGALTSQLTPDNMQVIEQALTRYRNGGV